MNTQVKAKSGLFKVQANSTGFVFIAAVFAAVGGLLFGYDTGVISGALLFIKSQFHLSVFHQELVVSVVLIGATVGALSGGKLADAYGRRLMLLLTAVIFVAGAIVCAAAGSVGTLIAGRIVVGWRRFIPLGVEETCSASPSTTPTRPTPAYIVKAYLNRFTGFV